MSSTELATVTDIRNSTEASPAKAVVYVERLAARVDYRTGQDVFDVVDGGQNTVGEVEITGAALVNRLDGHVNLLKHVSDDYTEEVADAAIGREEAADGGRATNWVVDAYETADKKFGDFLPTLTEDAGWEDLFSKGLPMTASNGTEWNCLGYVRENILAILFCSGNNLPLILHISFQVKKTKLYSCASYIDTETILTHYSSSSSLFLVNEFCTR